MPERFDIVLKPHDASVPAHYAPNPWGSSLPPETPEPSLLKPILRQWWLVMLFALLAAGGALIYINSAQQLFTSYAKIYIPPTSGVVVDATGAVERGNYLSTQVEVIRSSTILNRVAQLKGMPEMKTFAPANGNVFAFLHKEVDVDLERKTDLIVVSLSSPYSQESAQIVNSIVDTYSLYCQEEKDNRNNKVITTLEDSKKNADKQIEDRQQAIREFKIKNPTVTLGDQKSHEINVLQQISSRLNDAELRLIDARATFAGAHPRLKQLEQQVADMRRLYEDAMDKAARINAKAAELQRLTSDLERHKEFGVRVGERLQQLSMATSGRKLIDVDVVEPARVADRHSYPREKRTMAVALVIGSLIGAGLALLRDRMDGRMKSVEEIQTVMGMPILGVVPAMTGRRTAVARAMTVHLDPRSVVAEAYRTIRTAVFFGANGSRCKTLLVTSPEPGDGKTTSASNLAIAIAQTGRTVLLLDADFRKPTQHKNLDIKDSVGLSSVLAAQVPLERAIQHTGVEGLDILPCGPIPSNPSEILNSREFAELIDSLAGQYDHILFDSPPVNPVTDSRILGAVCDATVMVLRADKSTKAASEHARAALLSVNARLLGAIVNDAPKRKGYEVYGGTYYGSAEPHGVTPSTRRLTAVSPGDYKQAQQPKRGIA